MFWFIIVGIIIFKLTYRIKTAKDGGLLSYICIRIPKKIIDNRIIKIKHIKQGYINGIWPPNPPNTIQIGSEL